MAVLSITPANVIRTAQPRGDGDIIAGEAIDAGELIYKLSTDSKAYLAIANDTAAKAIVIGIALNSAAAGQVVDYARSGTITINAVATAGTLYFLGATAGKIDVESALLSNSYKTLIGIGGATTTLDLHLWVSGEQVP